MGIRAAPFAVRALELGAEHLHGRALVQKFGGGPAARGGIEVGHNGLDLLVRNLDTHARELHCGGFVNQSGVPKHVGALCRGACIDMHTTSHGFSYGVY
eukprot:1158633-Pelagomonas_calceolata.AAC.1